jgi:hypothetical protein
MPPDLKPFYSPTLKLTIQTNLIVYSMSTRRYEDPLWYQSDRLPNSGLPYNNVQEGY